VAQRKLVAGVIVVLEARHTLMNPLIFVGLEKA
jgi:hypothetical protein